MRILVGARSVFSLVLLSAVLPVAAQELPIGPRRSNHLWMDLGVRAKLSERLRATGEMGYRTGDELRRGQQFFLSGDLRYKLHKHFAAGIEQRASFRPNTPVRHRTGVMLRADVRVGRATLDYRVTYQHIWREPTLVRDRLRHRFGVEYDIRKFRLDPEFSVEVFTAYLPGGGSEYDAIRYRLGTGWSPAKGHRLSFALVHDREQNRRRPDRRTVFAVGYLLNLDKLGRK